MRKKHKVEKVKDIYEKVQFGWYILFGLSFVFMVIGFLYDIAMIIEGKIATFVYPVIYFVICFALTILSFFDYIFNEKYFYTVLDNYRIIKKSDLSEENKIDENNEKGDENQNERENENRDIKEENKNENKSKID